MLNKINKFSLFIITLFPLFLITGPFLTNLLITLMGIYALYEIFIKKFKKFFYKNYIKFFCILFFFFYLILLMSSLTSSNIQYSLQESLLYFRFIFFALGIAFLLINVPNIYNYFFVSIFLILFFVSFDSLIQYYFGNNIFGFPYTQNRVSGVFNDEKILGSFLLRTNLIFITVIYYLFSISDKFRFSNYLKFFLIINIILSAYCILLSGERLAFIFLCIYFLFFLFIFFNFKKLILFYSGFIFLIFLLIFSNVNLKERLFNDTFNDFTFGFSINNTDGLFPSYLISPQYSDHYNTAYLIFLDHPFLGSGPKMFDKLCNKDKYAFHNGQKINSLLIEEYDISVINGCSSHPHNFYIQLLSETGIIGFMFLFIFFIYSFYIILKNKILIFKIKDKKKQHLLNYESLIMLNIFIILFPLAPSGDFFSSWLSFYTFFNIGLLLNYKFKN